jgi:hypothetical protein
MYREIITANCNNFSEHSNTMLEQNPVPFNITYAYGNKSASDGETCVIHSLVNSNKSVTSIGIRAERLECKTACEDAHKRYAQCALLE